MYKQHIFTGVVKYDEIEYQFVFDGEALRLLPPVGGQFNPMPSHHWIDMGNGWRKMGASKIVEQSAIIGICNETQNRVVFLPSQGSRLGNHSSVLLVNVEAYALFSCKNEPIDQICFYCPEINYIHPVNQAVEYTFDFDKMLENGVFELKSKKLDLTQTTEQSFDVNGKTVCVSFGMSYKLSTGIKSSPITLTSSLIFTFEPTNDYRFLFRLHFLAKAFIQFLCYRNNIAFQEDLWYAPDGDGKHKQIANFYILGEEEINTETAPIETGRYIKQCYIDGCEGKILSQIQNNKLYRRHIPESYVSGSNINTARFIKIMAAFEWEFRRAYPDGIPASKEREKAEQIVADKFSELISTSTGKVKEIYKFAKKTIKRKASLQNQIEYVLTNYSEIIDDFGKLLYKMNGIEYQYSEIASRLAEQRNDFAHGNLSKEFIGESIVDLIFMERVLYALQLTQAGVDQHKIKHSINDLFQCRLKITH